MSLNSHHLHSLQNEHLQCFRHFDYHIDWPDWEMQASWFKQIIRLHIYIYWCSNRIHLLVLIKSAHLLISVMHSDLFSTAWWKVWIKEFVKKQLRPCMQLEFCQYFRICISRFLNGLNKILGLCRYGILKIHNNLKGNISTEVFKLVPEYMWTYFELVQYCISFCPKKYLRQPV